MWSLVTGGNRSSPSAVPSCDVVVGSMAGMVWVGVFYFCGVQAVSEAPQVSKSPNSIKFMVGLSHRQGCLAFWRLFCQDGAFGAVPGL